MTLPLTGCVKRRHCSPIRTTIRFGVAAYRRAADAVAALDTDLRDLLETVGIETLQAIPGVGPRIADGLAELAGTGRWTYLERLRGSGEPLDIFCTSQGWARR